MKRLLLILLCFNVVSFGQLAAISFGTDHVVYAEREIPAYAKWGKLAVEKTAAKYTNAKVIDYLHIGRETGTKTTIEKFKLWLKNGNKEFGVLVNIEFANETEQIVKITFKEVSR